MPIEIKELVIRAVVDSRPGADPTGEHGGRAPLEREASAEEIIQECVRQVLRVLRTERER